MLDRACTWLLPTVTDPAAGSGDPPLPELTWPDPALRGIAHAVMEQTPAQVGPKAVVDADGAAARGAGRAAGPAAALRPAHRPGAAADWLLIRLETSAELTTCTLRADVAATPYRWRCRSRHRATTARSRPSRAEGPGARRGPDLPRAVPVRRRPGLRLPAAAPAGLHRHRRPAGNCRGRGLRGGPHLLRWPGTALPAARHMAPGWPCCPSCASWPPGSAASRCRRTATPKRRATKRRATAAASACLTSPAGCRNRRLGPGPAAGRARRDPGYAGCGDGGTATAGSA